VTAPTTLYRLFSNDRALLYIGIAGNPGRRFEQHAGDKLWWGEVATLTLEHFTDRATALVAERRAIETERPLHNVVHNRGAGLAVTGGMGPTGRRWEFTHAGAIRSSTLWLYPELDLSSCVDDVYWADGQEQLEYYIDYVQSHEPEWWDGDAVPISWYVRGDNGIAEVAPFFSDPISRKVSGHHENFLTYFTWPTSVDTGESLDWFTLDIGYRFEEFSKALAWSPAPFQTMAPLRSIWASRNGWPYTEPNPKANP
jgi:predicted GIY-YIG superfamily endonuclease